MMSLFHPLISEKMDVFISDKGSWGKPSAGEQASAAISFFHRGTSLHNIRNKVLSPLYKYTSLITAVA